MPKLNRTIRPRFVSLFSGCGGFDIGFARMGFRCEAAFDTDQVALKHHSDYLMAPSYCFDLSTGVLPSGLSGPADIVLAGPPCQGFSTAGLREINDPRNHLLIAAGKIVLRIKPKVCVIENVPGAAYGAHRRYWEDLQALLRSAGYSTAAIKCRVSDFGVAQMRTRLILIGWRSQAHITPELGKGPYSVLRDVVRNIGTIPNHSPTLLDSDCLIGRIATHIKPGQKLSNVRGGPHSVHTWDLPSVFGTTTRKERQLLEGLLRLRRRLRRRDGGDSDPVTIAAISEHLGHDASNAVGVLVKKGYIRRIGSYFDLTHSFNGKYRRLRWDKPSFAVDTRFGSPRYFLHPEENRGFTVREAARIQGFPDDFVFHGPISSQFRMIGNAVPPPMSETIARFVKTAFFS